MNIRRWIPALGLAVLGLSAVALPLAAQDFLPRRIECPPCAHVANTFIRSDIGPNGTWVLGTTGGDPDTALDDDKPLHYGFQPGGASSVGTGYVTLRVRGPAGTVDWVHTEDGAQTVQSDGVETTWTWREPYALRVIQKLAIEDNPFSGRPDVLGIRYTVVNEDARPLEVGLRALLDIQIGNTPEADGAPYFVPGVGAVTTEQDFQGAAVPAYWLAFESERYDPSRLRGLGILDAPGLVRPDRFVIAFWRLIKAEKWDYTVSPTRPITADSAVALYWNPAPLAPGATRAYASQYGLNTSRGGSAFVSAPSRARCGETIDVAIFVSNFDAVPLTGGLAELSLPPDFSLAAGQTLQKPIATIPPGGTGSAVWKVQVGASAAGMRRIEARARFDGDRRFEAASELEVACEGPPTPSAPPPTATATPEPPPSPTPTRPSLSAEPCAFILPRVPAAVIADALANPERVLGWMQPQNPGIPPGPNNPPRTRLSLLNPGVPYHPLSNPVVYKVGCP